MIRKAKITDVKQIQGLINLFAKKDLMLPRSLNQLYENLRDFWVIEQGGKIIGCCAVHLSWENLAEIKSLAVLKKYQEKGMGTKLVYACLLEARELGAKSVFVLTYRPAFFKKFGFKRISSSKLPHKIWAECINCAKFPDCQEVAMVKDLRRAF